MVDRFQVSAVMNSSLRKARFFFVVLVWMGLASVASAADVNGVRLWRAPDNTRLVFDLSGSVEYKLADLPGENGKAQRIVITIQDAQFNADIGKVSFANTPLAKFASEKNGRELNLVIDLSSRTNPKSFLLPANNQYGNRLVLDLYDEIIKEPESGITRPPASGLRDVMIAVDPGHGGEDPGAKGPGNIFEKNITLAIARELVRLINDTPGYSAFLTRTGDYYVSLRGRTQIARNKGADLFVSVHADAFKDSSAQGAGVFALSQRGATSETARWLAQSENEADLVGGVNLTDKDPVLQGVLLDLSMTATVATSLDMGDKVVEQMKKIAKMHRGYVEQAGFVVLKNPDIPSLLIETGFITNQQEAKKLSDPAYRAKLAKSIFAGIDNHFRAKPPMDTALAAARGGKVKPTMDKVVSQTASDPVLQQKPVDSVEAKKIIDDETKPAVTEVVVRRDSEAARKAATESDELEMLVAEKTKPVERPKPAENPKQVTHLVKRGDTLTGIASRYKVSPAAIRKTNKMPDEQVRIGQKLIIPASSR